MKERPIIFDGESVRAILAGNKTQTRRVVKPQASDEWLPEVGFYHPTKVDRHGDMYPGEEVFGASDEEEGRVCPYGAPGVALWVRETFCPVASRDPHSTEPRADDLVHYRADANGDVLEVIDGVRGWTSPMFMPRVYARLTLRVTDVRVERLNSISELDCEAELGAAPHSLGNGAYSAFSKRWNAINGKRGFPWATNPWVWVVTFERVGASA